MSATWTGEHSQPAGSPAGSVPATLPRVVASSVVRASDQGESHGGVYLIDLRTGESEQVIDWNDESISWDGRGADRGLRGIAFHDGEVFLAASDEIFVYDRGFRQLRSHTNRYLKHCHEITVADGLLYATSTGFDSVLVLDLATGRWVAGHHMRFSTRHRLAKRLGQRPVPPLRSFDPESPSGPSPADTTHINSVWVSEGVIYACGTKLGHLVAVSGGRVRSHAVTPYHTHNARPFDGGVLLNHTRTDRICLLDPDGGVREQYPIHRYPPDRLQHVLTEDKARQGFGRGLAVIDGELLVGGSSPATISLYRRGRPDPITSVNLTMDVRNAIHGLEVWPFDEARG
jgi:hypothetical protein